MLQLKRRPRLQNLAAMRTGVQMANWSHRFPRQLLVQTTYRFSCLRTDVTPFFAGLMNVSGAAGITGNLQDSTNWGPPNLNFSSGISSLTDGISTFDRNRTDGVGVNATWTHCRHTVTLKRQRQQAYGDKAFALGFSAISGSFRQGGHHIREMPAAPIDSVEVSAWRGTDSTASFVGSVQLAATRVIPGAFFQHSYESLAWSTFLDGVVVLRFEHAPVDLRGKQ